MTEHDKTREVAGFEIFFTVIADQNENIKELIVILFVYLSRGKISFMK